MDYNSVMPRTEFVARAIYHHRIKTDQHVTLIVRHGGDSYELWDDREDSHDYLAGTEEFILDEWGSRNRNLDKENFQNDNRTGPDKWMKFIS
jgi:hypothetical protein